jgi:curved DNA-binding protein CbpA
VATAFHNARGGADLPADLQQELLDLDARLVRISHYELLGVSPDADAASIRRAYLLKSKRFHPDAWYGKDVGDFAPLLSKAFQRLSAAYQVLSDEDTRAAYDRDHAGSLTNREREAIERRALSREEQERRSREGRERLLRTKGFARVGAARKLYEEALELALAGERAQAIASLQTARELDPNRKEIAAKLGELERETQKARARSALQSADERERRNDLQSAFTAYVQSFQMEQTYAAALGAARVGYALRDFHHASTYAARAAELALPGDVEARFLLAKSLVDLGLKARARPELQRVVATKPDHAEARSLLKRV